MQSCGQESGGKAKLGAVKCEESDEIKKGIPDISPLTLNRYILSLDLVFVP